MSGFCCEPHDHCWHCTKGNCICEEGWPVTITISREDAEHYAKPAVIFEELKPYLFRLNDACRAALEGER